VGPKGPHHPNRALPNDRYIVPRPQRSPRKSSLSLLIPPANLIRKTARTPRVPTFKYPIPPHTIAAWKSHVEIDSHSPTSLAIVTANAILTNLQDPTNPTDTPDPTEHVLCGRDLILSLATDLQTILGDAMHLATTIRKRTKALRRLAALAAATPLLTLESISDTESPYHQLWLKVTTPVTLRTVESPPIRNLQNTYPNRCPRRRRRYHSVARPK
jgi:hypothetical protein